MIIKQDFPPDQWNYIAIKSNSQYSFYKNYYNNNNIGLCITLCKIITPDISHINEISGVV